MTVSAAIEPQRPSQSNESGSTAVTLLVSAEVAAPARSWPWRGDSSVGAVAGGDEAKPVAQTAPVASPTAPNASQAASRGRDG